MDPEQTFLNVHMSLCGMLSQWIPPKIMTALEHLCLIIAIALFCFLVVMHTNFVGQPSCSSELSAVEMTGTDLVQIKITPNGLWAQVAAEMDTAKQGTLTGIFQIPVMDGDGLTFLAAKFSLNFIGSGVGRGKLLFSSFWESTKQFFTNMVQLQRIGVWEMLLDIPKWAHTFRLERIDLFIVHWLEKRSKAFEPTFLYTVEKGYRMLSEGAKSKHNISTINVSISAQHSCFGNRWQRLLISSFVGYDTILVNSLLNASGQGYFYNLQTNEAYDLHYFRKSAKSSSRSFTEKAEDLAAKCGVVMVSLFVFLTTTMSVSFTFRETQSRMLKFTVQLQHHARHQLPTFQLIFVHVIRSLVFVPIMIGTLFFLFECYDDQLLAIMVLLLVWQGVVFTIISARTPLSMQYFPRFFLLYFLVFHIYFFSYTYGFSYLAFTTTAAFMQHLVLYFWNRFEIPAFQRFTRHQFQLQQQAGVRITSSTILTSTLHIARVNMRNPNFFNELGPTPRPGPGSGQDQARANPVDGAEITRLTESSSTSNPDVAGSPQPLPESNLQHPETAPNSNSPNSVSSRLLWILGGGSGDALVSYLLSRFRDMRDQGQVYEEPSQLETSRPVENS